MRLVSKTIVYTKEDMAGFCFFDVPEEKKEEKLQKALKKNTQNIKICCLLLMISLILGIIINNEIFWYGNVLFEFVVLFFLVVFLHARKTEKQHYKKGSVKAHRIEIIKKLPIESFRGINSGTVKFYPVLGKDVVNGYESICYIPKEDYINHEVGQIVECWTYSRNMR